MIIEDSTRRTIVGKNIGASWYKNLKRVYVSMRMPTSGPKSRAAMRARAQKSCEGFGFPAWKVIDIRKARDVPDLCIVIGEVQ